MPDQYIYFLALPPTYQHPLNNPSSNGHKLSLILRSIKAPFITHLQMTDKSEFFVQMRVVWLQSVSFLVI